MDSRRYQVFISSTFTDLKDERRWAMQAVLEMECFPASMELFPAADDSAWEYIKTIIDESDFYLVIVGGRYGSTDDTGLSFTEREYDYAVARGKPVIAFLHEQPGKLPADAVELTREGRDALEAFRRKVSTRLCKFWSSAPELKSHVMAGLMRLRKSHPQGGWVRAEAGVSSELKLELEQLKRSLAEANQRIAELDSELAKSKQPLAPLQPAGARAQELMDNVKVPLTEYSVGSPEPGSVEVEVGWIDIFNLLGPRLAESPREVTYLHKWLQDWLIARTPYDETVTSTHLDKLEADRLVWHLHLLGLVELSEKKWQLSEVGLAQLRLSLAYWKEDKKRGKKRTERPKTAGSANTDL